jgi:RNA polymerase sigma-70 factor (ECF subfamily)
MSSSVLQRIADGNPSAVRECIDQYGALVWSLARRLTRSSADAEDATQEIFLEIWRNAARFDPLKGSDKTFIAVIARRRLIDRLRKLHREAPIDSVEVLEFIAWSEPPAAISETAMDVQQASHAFAQLRNEHREVLGLALVHGLSHSEIAAKLDMPLGTVKAYLRRGLAEIRELMQVEAVSTRGGTDV